MSLIISRKRPVQIFAVAAAIIIVGIYFLCDYHLNSVGHELMLNWVRTESALIQEGNLLTSSTKNQRFLLSSDYVRAVLLIKVENDQVRERLHFGDSASLGVSDIPKMSEEVVIKRDGFLHSRAFYKIPSRDEMYLMFDIESKVLNFVFFGGVVFLLFILITLVAIIRFVENQEFLKREEIFKRALNEFVSMDRPSEIIEKELPTLLTWWEDKKSQVEAAHQNAVRNQSKILLGEVTSRVAHDIIGSVRNIEILHRRTTGLNKVQSEHFDISVNKIKNIVADISKLTRNANQELADAKRLNIPTDIAEALYRIVQLKRIQYSGRAEIIFKPYFDNDILLCELCPLEFERSISNLINNAVEAASDNRSVVTIELKSQLNQIEILVIDNGKGISEEILNKVGHKGFTVDKENGTGIGIFYAREFFVNLGGSLNIESVLNKGTTVCMSIPKVADAARTHTEFIQ